MLQFFRNFTGSKLGIVITLAVLALIALAFAGGDIASNAGFGGVAGGDRVAVVGGARIDTSDLDRQARNAVTRLRDEDPTINIRKFAAQGGLEQVLSNLIDLTAIRRFGEKYGIHLGDRLIDSEIAKIQGIQGPDGKVSDQLYRTFLGQKGLSDAQLRDEIAGALMARQLLTSTELGLAVPDEAAVRYAGIITEQRTGVIGLLPSALFAPKTPPTEAELAAYYAANKANYTRPERRTIRYASFDDSVVSKLAVPTEAEIAARYQANKAQYAASESRRVSQLVLPTEAAAKAVVSEVAGGKSLEAAAGTKGLAVASLGALSRESLSGQTSAAIAEAAFAAGKGKMVGPLKGTIGWVLLRIDAIEGKPERSLDQVRGELTKAIAVEKQREALTDFSTEIEDEFDGGAALSDVAKELGLTLTETPTLLANGQVYGQSSVTAPPILARVIQTAFSMEAENQPQLAEVVPGKTFVIFDVTSIAASEPAPLAEIRDQVIAEYGLSKGSIAAKAAAQKIEAMVRKGQDLGAAMATLGLPLPPVDRVQMGRQQLQAMGEQVPPPLVTMFQLARGTIRLLGAPRNRGWYLVAVTGITPGKVEATDPQLADFRSQVAQMTGQEYSAQLRAAMRKEMGVERNETAIAAVRRQLQGGN